MASRLRGSCLESEKVGRMDAVGEVKVGKMLTPQGERAEFVRPYLRVANVYENRIDLTDVKQMQFTPKEFEQYKLQAGDILLNEGQSPELRATLDLQC